MQDDEEAKVETSRKRSRERVEADRKRLADERALHEATVAAETERAKTDLDKLLDKLPEPERRAVRKDAYLLVLGGAFDSPGHLQAGVDAVALRLAKYMLTGIV